MNFIYIITGYTNANAIIENVTKKLQKIYNYYNNNRLSAYGLGGRGGGVAEF